MAETLTLLRGLLCCAMLCLAQAGAHAQELQDPTRPAGGGAANTAEGVDTLAGPQLQSVLVSRQPGGRHVAVIDGDAVRLGEMYKGARVARITPTEVELVRGKERQVLRLLPDDEAGPVIKRSGRLQ